MMMITMMMMMWRADWEALQDGEFPLKKLRAKLLKRVSESQSVEQIDTQLFEALVYLNAKVKIPVEKEEEEEEEEAQAATTRKKDKSKLNGSEE